MVGAGALWKQHVPWRKFTLRGRLRERGPQMIVCTPRGEVTRSSPRAVPIVVAGAVAALVAATLAIDDRHAAAAFLVAGLLTGAAAVVDAVEERIPNRLLLA